MSVERQTGRTPDRLNVPPVPPVFDRAMRLWAKLARHRESGWRVAPFSWRDFAAFVQVTGENLTQIDIDTIAVIDTAFFASREEAESRKGTTADAAKAGGAR